MEGSNVFLAFHSRLNKRSILMVRPSNRHPCLPLFPNSIKLRQHATATQSPVPSQSKNLNPKKQSAPYAIQPPANTETERKETELRHTRSPNSTLHPPTQVPCTTNRQHKSSFEPKRNSPPAIVRNTTTPSRRWKLQT
jgi:hypothetical protein